MSARHAAGPRVRPRILLITPEPVLGVALSQYLSGFFSQVALATSVATGCSMAGTLAGRYAALVVDADALDACVPTDAQAPHDARDPFTQLVTALPTLRGRIVVLGTPRHSLTLGAREVLSKPAPAAELLRAIDASVGPGLCKAQPRTAGALARHI